MSRRWWWPFGEDADADEAESHFIDMLKEASVRTDDLRNAADDLRAERLRRVRAANESKRAKLPSQPDLHTQNG